MSLTKLVFGLLSYLVLSIGFVEAKSHDSGAGKPKFKYGLCYSFDQQGHELKQLDTSECVDDKVAKHQVKGEQCLGLSLDNRVIETYADPINCGKVAYYQYYEGQCMAYDKKGHSLGFDLFHGKQKCRGDKIKKHETRGDFCKGLSKDDRIIDNFADPENCGHVSYYDKTKQGECMAYDLNDRPLGLVFSQDADTRCFVSSYYLQEKVNVVDHTQRRKQPLKKQLSLVDQFKGLSHLPKSKSK